MVGTGGLVVLALAWIVVTGLIARSELAEARADLDRLRQAVAADDLGQADLALDSLSEHAGTADDLVSGPAWALAADLPGGAPLRTARGLAAAVDEFAHGPLDELVQVRRQLDPSTLRGPGGSVRLAPIAAAAPAVAQADQQLRSTLRHIQALPTSTWLGSVDAARTELIDRLQPIVHTVGEVDVVTSVLPRMLGASGPQHYFVTFQNNAEARGTGGLPGAFGILLADRGTLRFERFESDSTLDGVSSGVDLGAQFDQLYGTAESTSLYVNSNISPTFPYAAQIWTAMWQRKTGERLDGAVALDPQALSYLLAVTGPATLPDAATVSAGNVVSLTESQLYSTYPATTDNGDRRAELLDIARAAGARIVSADAAPRALLSALRQAAGQRRLLVWSDDPSTEARLAPTEVSGTLPGAGTATVAPIVVNEDGAKLDYYLQRSATWVRSGCGASRDVVATMTLTNLAPQGLPPSVTTWALPTPAGVRPGDHLVQLAWYATPGALLRQATVDGVTVGATAGTEDGHPVYSVMVLLPRGASRTVVLQLVEPAGQGSPVVVRQPLALPQALTVRDAACR